MMRIVFFLCLLSVLLLTACSTNAGSQAKEEVVSTAEEPGDDGLTVNITLFKPEINCEQKEAKEGYDVECTIVRKRAIKSEWAEVNEEQRIRVTHNFLRPPKTLSGIERPCPDFPGWMCFCWGDECYPTYPIP